MAPVIGDPIARDNEAGRDEIADSREAGPWAASASYPELRDNRLAGFGVAVLGGYHAAKPQLYQDLVTPGSGVILSARLWTLCNVRYLALNQNVPPRRSRRCSARWARSSAPCTTDRREGCTSTRAGCRARRS